MTFDILAELEPYMDRFDRAKVIDNKLIACSPFRPDNTPSFVVFLDIGNWVDSGNVFQTKGTFFELLAFLSGDDVDEVKSMLFSKYGAVVDVDAINLSLNLSLSSSVQYPSMKPFWFRHPYLEGRGIDEATQRMFKVGFCNETKAVVIPWQDKQGKIVRLKFRTVTGKCFWYSKDGDRIKNHLFGLHQVRKEKASEVWLVEAEIDCMYLWSLGIPAVATGTASISKAQKKLLMQSGVESLVIASDNDTAGHKFREELLSIFGGTFKCFTINHFTGKKDINDHSRHEVDRLNALKLQHVAKFVRNL